MGICALARNEAALYGAEEAQEGAVWRDGKPSEGVAESHRLLPGEAGGVGRGPRYEGLRIEHTSVSEEVRVGSAQHQTAKTSIPEWPGYETP